ncbi:polyadenylate-binding protein 7-like [Hibiscus syriacus]|uniref:polyadenylate-binding protein 7-like n=1 Tax=Hibiscus syriacus TaxID=106335 RepID=UPI001922B0C2|nr:polyadenylate-binding protein 7-like [Hibiscus syriacus]
MGNAFGSLRERLILAGFERFVGKFVKNCDRILPSPDVKYKNLYVKNLDPDVTEEIKQEKFSEFGKIASLAVARDENGASRGFGFANFECPDDAKRAMESMNGSKLGSKVLHVARAQKKEEREQILRNQYEEQRKEQIMKYKASNVYVKNIDEDVTDDELRDLFSQCGTITSAKLMRDDKGTNKGLGFVCFSAPEEAAKAVGMFHGYIFHRKPLYVAIAQRKEDRQAQLQLRYEQCMARLAGPSTTILPGGYPQLYYISPTRVVSQIPLRPGMMYQPLSFWPGWRGNGFAPSARPVFQPSLPMFPTAPMQTRAKRARMNGPSLMQGSPHPVTYVPHSQQLTQTVNSLEDQSNQQWTGQGKYVPNGRAREVNKGSDAAPGGSNSVLVFTQGSEMLSSMLAAASPEQQKTILGERIYPLVHKHQLISIPDLVQKVTGMLLEMDNSELLLLLESPESLAAKVEEAVEVLKLSNAKMSGQDALRTNSLSAGVAVN